jgi:hypothetical protein
MHLHDDLRSIVRDSGPRNDTNRFRSFPTPTKHHHPMSAGRRQTCDGSEHHVLVWVTHTLGEVTMGIKYLFMENLSFGQLGRQCKIFNCASWFWKSQSQEYFQ